MALYEWPKMNPKQKKEKITFVILSISGWLLAILLILYPDISGPTQMIDLIFKPLGKMIEK
ncbi:hypothetical protein [Ammoniphilus sp. 3BR4]|uniref:hypothetical protein n=1 Tax=Ammoniphilus sp. 3BR4 TaxID=3158265 RepID=UPI003465D24C